MPIKVRDELPAKEILLKENIFVMDESRAFRQDIRPLNILILNLMPTKEITEVQILRLIGNTALQIDATLLHPKTHISKTTPMKHMISFYRTFEEVKDKTFDGMIITGAPIEHLEFEEVNYWKELTEIMEWSKENVTSTFHICWGAQAGLYYHYGVNKYFLPKKRFGVFEHRVLKKDSMLMRGFDDVFYVPHSRHTDVKIEDIQKVDNLEILAASKEAGLYIAASKDGKQIFVTGHSEYDPDTLKNEYLRDVEKGLDIEVPKNYFEDDDPNKETVVKWRSHANLLYSNWLNYYVYQETPYDIHQIKLKK